MRQLFVVRQALILVVALSARGWSQSASIDGDLFIVNAHGDMKVGAGRTVMLARATYEFMSRVRQLCRARDSAVAKTLVRQQRAIDDAEEFSRRYVGAADLAIALRMKDSVTWYRYLSAERLPSELRSFDEQIGRDLKETADAHGAPRYVRTTLNGHFRFAGLAAGIYVLLAEWRIDDDSYRWITRVSISEREHIKKDLDHDALMDQPFCTDHP